MHPKTEIYSIYSTTGNLLIDAFPPPERELFLSSAKKVSFESDEPVYEIEDVIQSVYFPINAVVSDCSLMVDGSSAEITLTGSEGVVGISAIFGDQTARHCASVLIAGEALKIETAIIRELVSKNESVRTPLLHFYHQLLRQISQRAVCNGRHTLLQRFCNWLLLVDERAGREEIPLTHETIARKLGARRAGVTNVAGLMQELKAISYTRGTIHIHDYEILKGQACECFNAIQNPL